MSKTFRNGFCKHGRKSFLQALVGEREQIPRGFASTGKLTCHLPMVSEKCPVEANPRRIICLSPPDPVVTGAPSVCLSGRLLHTSLPLLNLPNCTDPPFQSNKSVSLHPITKVSHSSVHPSVDLWMSSLHCTERNLPELPLPPRHCSARAHCSSAHSS